MDSELNSLLNKINKFCTFGSVLGLSRMEDLCEKLDHPEESLNVIHVAGTNGKGSVCRYIYEALREAGFSVGLYISPFITVFNERIEMNGNHISDDDLIYYSEMVLSVAKEMNEAPTEFELITAIALKYFSDKKTDYVVLEVGLGGRGDSTNIVKNPLISVITSIGLDHMERLGNSAAEIAYEKAGIIKNNVPVISAAIPDKAKEVISKIALINNSEFVDTTEVKYKILDKDIYKSEYQIDGVNIAIFMGGEHQITNSVTAYETLKKLRSIGKVNITDDEIVNGFKKAKQPGRFEVFNNNPYVIIDGAHNVDGAVALTNTLKTNFVGAKILLVIGILKDKAYNSMIDEFIKITDEFIVTEPNNLRKLSAIKLSKALEDKGAKCLIEPVPKEAYKRAMEIKSNYDVIVFAGSLYLIGEIRSFLVD
ncbi:MAG: bifunctional folylpolyglutamate synthase/dihydrofolate synthase [Peptostreptococcaceae bacterium]|nr:bifunctional folylpolyglutamate synthase/dihydrofolate synthase [Peptostreptococcaceae bacterium]